MLNLYGSVSAFKVNLFFLGEECGSSYCIWDQEVRDRICSQNKGSCTWCIRIWIQLVSVYLTQLLGWFWTMCAFVCLLNMTHYIFSMCVKGFYRGHIKWVKLRRSRIFLT